MPRRSAVDEMEEVAFGPLEQAAIREAISSLPEESDAPTTPFKPGACKPEIEFDGAMPSILITPEAYSDMFALIDEADDEISWLGTVVKQGDDYLIKEVFLPEQECGAASTEMTEKGLTKLASEILARPDGVAVWNSIRFWGHSHVRMDVFASSTDDAQMKLFKEQVKGEWFIRGIFNKVGCAKFWFFQYGTGVVINDVPWSIYAPVTTDRRKLWKALIRKKVKKHTYAVSSYGGTPWFGGGPLGGVNWRSGYGGGYDGVGMEGDPNAGGHAETLLSVRPRRVQRPISGHCRRRGGR